MQQLIYEHEHFCLHPNLEKHSPTQKQHCNFLKLGFFSIVHTRTLLSDSVPGICTRTEKTEPRVHVAVSFLPFCRSKLTADGFKPQEDYRRPSPCVLPHRGWVLTLFFHFWEEDHCAFHSGALRNSSLAWLARCCHVGSDGLFQAAD